VAVQISPIKQALENGCLSSLTTWQTAAHRPTGCIIGFGIRPAGGGKINLNGMHKQVISLENQPRGMYFIRVLGEKQTETAKILKQ
jgi:hypothetical protein